MVRLDTLSKVAKEFYGNASKYPVIFEANRPMLSHPDKIYPVRCCALQRLARRGLERGHRPERIEPTPPMARTAPAPAAPKRWPALGDVLLGV